MGCQHRKRSGGQQLPKSEGSGSGLATAAGALLHGIPEFIVIDLSMPKGGTVSIDMGAAIFLSDVPETLSSVAGMKKAERGAD